MKIFVICPVRYLKKEEKRKILKHIEELEEQGHQVHYPPRDTDQLDPIGYKICVRNATAIIDADEVHIYWNGKSKGSLFDFGMTFVMKKTVRLINNIEPTKHKSFENVLLKLDEMGRKEVK